MRQIKFRAWALGEIHKVESFNCDRQPPFYFIKPDASPVITRVKDPNFVLMQFTGLKDRSGKEIYEGDVLTSSLPRYPFVDEGKPNYVAIVEWLFAGFHIVLSCVNPKKAGISNGINEPLEDGEMFLVIGNIYENPELMTKPVEPKK